MYLSRLKLDIYLAKYKWVEKLKLLLDAMVKSMKAKEKWSQEKNEKRPTLNDISCKISLQKNIQKLLIQLSSGDFLDINEHLSDCKLVIRFTLIFY